MSKSTASERKKYPRSTEPKKCTKCELVRPADAFSTDSRAKSGLVPQCRECVKVGRAGKREELCAGRKAWRQANPEKALEYQRRYYAENTAKVTAAARERYKRNREHIRTRHHAWRRDNLDSVRESYRRRQAAVAATSNATAEGLAARWAYYGDRCWVCRKQADQTDHVKPLSAGGPHLLANLRPACSACNKRMGARWPLPAGLLEELRSGVVGDPWGLASQQPAK